MFINILVSILSMKSSSALFSDCTKLTTEFYDKSFLLLTVVITGVHSSHGGGVFPVPDISCCEVILMSRAFRLSLNETNS